MVRLPLPPSCLSLLSVWNLTSFLALMGFQRPLEALTSYLAQTYTRTNPSFRYEVSHNPRRVLTKPSKGVLNDGHDNEDNDYILYVNDYLGTEEGHK